MKYSILVLGVIASVGISFFNQSSASATPRASQQKAATRLTAFESHPDFNYTGTNEDGEQEEVKTGKGRK